MELRLLGPLELVDSGEQVAIGGPRQRVVLAMLALEANRVTPLEQLIEAVWGQAPPVTARSQIQICISALRRMFADTGRSNAIVTRASGYLLTLDVDELDVARFSRLVATAREHADRNRPAESADELRAALALWRGPALMGVQSDLVQRSAPLLDGQRLAAIEERIRLDLLLGRHDEIIGELFELVEREPLRERLHGSLMLALYRAGRQAEALDCYRRMRAIFVSELGIEPGKELQQLESAILTQDPALDLGELPAAVEEGESEVPAAVDTVPRQLPSDIGDFTGRSEHLSEIRQYLGADTAGRSCVRVLAITGKGGVGKTALAVRAAHEVAEAYPDGQLYANLHGVTSSDGAAQVLSRFLRALGVAGTSVPEDTAERAAMYRSRVAGRRILVVLDDVHGEQLVQALLPGSPSCAMIVTSRSRLTGLPGVLSVNLDVFNTELSVQLLGNIAGEQRVTEEQSAAVQLAELCAGLPLALRIAGARLACRPHWRIAQLVRRLRDEAGRLDEFAYGGLELRSNIGLAYRALDEQAQRLFRLFALIQAPDFAAWTAAALLDADIAKAEDILESLVDVQLLDVVSQQGERIRYRFHDLIKVYARERLVESEPTEQSRQAAERVLGCWLALAQEAHRREYGGDYTIMHGGAPRWRPADAVVDELVENPMAWWESERRALVAAVRHAGTLELDELCWDLALTSVTLFEAKGYFDDWRETSEYALSVTEVAGNRRGGAAMLYSLGTLNMFQQHLEEAERCFGPAAERLAELGDEHGKALVLRNMAHVDRLRGDHAGMLAKYEVALEGLRAAGDRAGEAHVLYNIARVQLDDGEHDTARETLNAALTICRSINCLRVEAQVIYRLGELYLRTDEVGLANQAFNWALRIVRQTCDPIGETHALYGLGRVHWHEGRAEEAEAAFIQSLTLAKQIGERLVEGQVLYALGEIARDRRSYPAAVVHLTAAGEVFGKLGSDLLHAKAKMAMSEVHTATGNAAVAAGEVHAALWLLSGLDSPEARRLATELTRRQPLMPQSETA